MCGREQVQGLGLHCQGRNFILSHLCLNRRARHSRAQNHRVLQVSALPILCLKLHAATCDRLPGPTQPYLNSQKLKLLLVLSFAVVPGPQQWHGSAEAGWKISPIESQDLHR